MLVSSPERETLAAGFRGRLLTPQADGYDHARRVYNAMIDRRPALIAYCTGVADVAAALAYARGADLPVAVRSGGHSVCGHGVCDGGVVIDLSAMKGVRIDPRRRVAFAQPGLTWGEFDREAELYGLATTGGRVSITGLGGLILGSGSGWLERRHGSSADNLLSVDVLTADGGLVHASEDENPELFWGIRGGGGNFGIVTCFELRLHPVPAKVLAGLVFHRFDQAAELMRGYRDLMEQASDEVFGALVLTTAPPAAFIPPDLQGRPTVAMVLGFLGEAEEGIAALAELRGLASRAVDLVGPTRYTELQRLLDAPNPPGLQNWWRAENLRELPDDAIDAIVERGRRMRSPSIELVLLPLGGAHGRVADDAMALGARDTPWQLQVLGKWADPAESDEHISWARATAEAVQPYTRPGIPPNFTSEETEEQLTSIYGAKLGRLRALKDEYDPDNVFRLNHNITPSA